MRFLRSIAMGSVLAVLVSVPVLGVTPARSFYGGTFEFPFAECDGFEIIGSGWFAINEGVFASRDGSERIIQQFMLGYSMSRSDTGAIVGTGQGSSVLHAPLDGTSTSTWVGARAIERYAGGSSVVEIGRIVFDSEGDPVFVAGPHPFSTTGVDRCSYVQP